MKKVKAIKSLEIWTTKYMDNYFAVEEKNFRHLIMERIEETFYIAFLNKNKEKNSLYFFTILEIAIHSLFLQ